MNKTALTCVLAMFCLFCSAQISINSANYNTVSINETNILQSVISNNGNAVQVTATATVKNSAGELIAEGTTRPFTLKQGMNSVSGAITGFSRFSFGGSAQAMYLKSNGILPSGNYAYCLRVRLVGFGEDGDVYCEEFASANEDFLNLVSPYDKDTLDTKLPVLIWTHSEPFNVLAKNEYFKIIVTELKKDQSADQAVFSNPNVFYKVYVINHSVPYPQDAKELEQGKTYAWQIQKFSNNILVNKTDAWSFTLSKPKKKADNKYAVMKTNYDASYYTAYNEKIFFQFEEPYHGSELKYTIYNSSRKEVKADMRNERKANTAGEVPYLKEQGNNLYELDLSAYKLKKGYYFLEVQDEKKRITVLKFYIEE